MSRRHWLAVVCLFLLIEGRASAAVIFSDNFESYGSGGTQIPSPPYAAGTRAYTSAAGWGANGTIAAELGAGGAGDELVLTIPATPVGYLSFDTAYWGTGNSTSNQIATVVGSTDQALLGPVNGDYAYYYDPDNGFVSLNSPLNVGAYQAGRTYETVLLTWNATSTDLYIDGTQIGGPGSATPNFTRDGTGTLGSVTQIQWLFNGGTGQWVDNLVVGSGPVPVPEPASCTLILGATMGALMRRRKRSGNIPAV